MSLLSNQPRHSFTGIPTLTKTHTDGSGLCLNDLYYLNNKFTILCFEVMISCCRETIVIVVYVVIDALLLCAQSKANLKTDVHVKVILMLLQ